MSNKQFISNLSATYADIRRLDAKKINLKGKNILEYIEESVPIITHSKDTRETVYENDLWGQWIETKDDGTIAVHDDYLSNPNSEGAWLSNVKAVQDNKAYSEIITDDEGNFTGVVEDSVVANIQTEMIKDGTNMFSFTSFTSFSGDLSSLVSGYQMFHYNSLESFNGDLSSLVNGTDMFSYNISFVSFSGDLSSLVNGDSMFYNTSLTSFSDNLGSLVDGSNMFSSTKLTSFSGDLSSLVNGSAMFSGTPLTSFSSDLSSLVNGWSMFNRTALTSFSGDLSSLVNGWNMFYYNTSLASFSGDLSSLVYGRSMFHMSSLVSFSSDLSSLVNGSYMFEDTSLESFSGDLSNLVDGRCMFEDTSLTSFSKDLSSLVNGESMFYYTYLESFSGDLSSLVYGQNMFSTTSLKSFSGDLSSLVNGMNMFYDISLDVESVELICDVLPNYNTENGGKQLQTATWNTSGENKGKYTYSDWTSGIYNYPIIEFSVDNITSMSKGNIDGIKKEFGTDSISESNVKTITISWNDISVLSEEDRTAITKLFSDTATEKGWTFITNTELGGTVSPNAVMAADGTIQYYIFAKKDEATEDDATHIDANGKLWKFDTAEAIIGPNIKYWSMFATVEDALTEWELTPWTKPTEEETEA